MCDEKLDNTLPDIVQCSSREVREKKIQEIQKQNPDTSFKWIASNNPPLTKR